MTPGLEYVELHYPELTVDFSDQLDDTFSFDLWGRVIRKETNPIRTISYTYLADKEEVREALQAFEGKTRPRYIWSEYDLDFSEEEEDDEKFNALVKKYYDKLLDKFRDAAIEDAQENYQLNESVTKKRRVRLKR